MISLSNRPVVEFIFSIIKNPPVVSVCAKASTVIRVVSEAVISAASVVDNSKPWTVIAVEIKVVSIVPIPAVAVNLTWSFTCIPLLGWLTTILDVKPEGKLNGFEVNRSAVGGSVLAGLACGKPWASAPCGFGSNCGCLGSNSETCTLNPSHCVTISLYGNAIPDWSEMNCAYLPFEKLDIWIISFWWNECTRRWTIFS